MGANDLDKYQLNSVIIIEHIYIFSEGIQIRKKYMQISHNEWWALKKMFFI